MRRLILVAAILTLGISTGSASATAPVPGGGTGHDGGCEGEPDVLLPPLLCVYADNHEVLVHLCVEGVCRDEVVRHGRYTENVVEALTRIYEDPVEAVCRHRC